MPLRFPRFFAQALLLICTVVMLSASFDAEARRLGGGRSSGRQSLNITKQRQAVTPPVAKTAPGAAKSATTGDAAGKTGLSRWLAPVAGMVGLGIGALLAQFGLSGAFLETLSSLVLIGLVLAAVVFIARRLLGGAMKTYARQASGPADAGDGDGQRSWAASRPGEQGYARAFGAASAPNAPQSISGDADDWFIPGDFDIAAFLAQAEKQFAAIQAAWDDGDVQTLSDYLTDDLVAELKPQILENRGATHTEIVLLNVELLGIETVSDGHLASVRYSGMLREDGAAQAFRFEEVWNLYKAENSGWLLAGIQQIPMDPVR